MSPTQALEEKLTARITALEEALIALKEAMDAFMLGQTGTIETIANKIEEYVTRPTPSGL